MQHYDILIATPGAMMEAQYVKSLVATLAECDKRGLTYKFLNAYGSLVHHARELTCSGGDGMEFNPSEQIQDIVEYRSRDRIIKQWLDFDKKIGETHEQ